MDLNYVISTYCKARSCLHRSFRQFAICLVFNMGKCRVHTYLDCLYSSHILFSLRLPGQFCGFPPLPRVLMHSISPESSWFEVRRWWCRWGFRDKCRSSGAAKEARSRDYRSREGGYWVAILREVLDASCSQCQDPYILRNHLGSLECRLCLTLHTNEGSYLAHTQGKKHQTNLARRAARDAKDTQLMIAPTQSTIQRKVFLKIGRPGYRVTKVRDRETGKEGMMVQVHLPQVK